MFGIYTLCIFFIECRLGYDCFAFLPNQLHSRLPKWRYWHCRDYIFLARSDNWVWIKFCLTFNIISFLSYLPCPKRIHIFSLCDFYTYVLWKLGKWNIKNDIGSWYMVQNRMIGQDGPNPSRFKRSFIWDGSFICVLKQLKLVDMWTSYRTKKS